MTDELKNKRLGYKCPECGQGEQIIKQNSHNLSYFISCTQWPDCKWTSELPESIKMRLAGQKGLFD